MRGHFFFFFFDLLWEIKKEMRVERARRRGKRRRIEGEKTWRVKNSIIGDEVGFFDDSPPSLFILRSLPGVVG